MVPRDGNGIEFQNVNFSYDGIRPILHDCSFSVPACKSTLLLGPSGCGKTTVARLILAFWRPNSGEILIGGASHRNFSPVETRLHMSYVAQSDHIVEETVRENLAWAHGAGFGDVQRMQSALKSVGLSEDILDLPASQLSLGEKQRLSIARMLLDSSEITIMDEPMAGVDVHTVSELLPYLKQELRERGHTVLVISHRLAFAAFVDHVIVMNEKGVVIEEGRPDHLWNKHGEFRRLYNAALGELALPQLEEVKSLLS
jgi:ABC-type multidrug transport system fused ATPase/permease subunit